MTTNDTILIAVLSAALDEIWLLRAALAHEAEVLEGYLAFKSFPTSRRDIADRQLTRMRSAARGDVLSAYAGTSSLSLANAALQLRTQVSLTIEEFAAERARTSRAGSDSPVERDELAAAVEEVRRLRMAAAYERAVIDVHTHYAAFPKSCRPAAVAQQERLADAARGRVSVAYAGTSASVLSGALVSAGADPCLTRGQYQAELRSRRA